MAFLMACSVEENYLEDHKSQISQAAAINCGLCVIAGHTYFGMELSSFSPKIPSMFLLLRKTNLANTNDVQFHQLSKPKTNFSFHTINIRLEMVNKYHTNHCISWRLAGG